MSDPFVYRDLLEACVQPGCPLCRLVQQSVKAYLVNFFYEGVNDVTLRQELRGSLGFCRLHAWQVLEPGTGDTLGVAILYHDVLTTVLRRLPESGPAGENGSFSPRGNRPPLNRLPRRLVERIKNAVKGLTPQAPCPACQQEENATQRFTSELVDALEKEELAEAFTASDGLCLPHLRQALAGASDEVRFARLVAIGRQKLAALDAELAEIIRKHDYRYRGEEMGHERDAWRRVVAVAVGERRTD